MIVSPLALASLVTGAFGYTVSHTVAASLTAASFSSTAYAFPSVGAALTNETQLKYIDINGASLAYKYAGAPDGRLIITLHGGRGFGSHSGDFSRFADFRDEYRVLSFDYRGHGQSSHTEPYTFAQIVDDIEAIRKHFNGDKPAIIAGGSFGGFLAQQYAITYPDSVEHLVLRVTAPSHHHEDGAVEKLIERLDEVPQVSVDILRNKVFGSYESDLEFRLVIFAIQPLYSTSGFDADATLARVLEGRYNYLSHKSLYSPQEKFFDYRDRLHTINAKTLILAGSEDWICPAEESVYISEHIPNNKLHIFEGAGHSFNSSVNALAATLIRQHLST